MTTKRISRDTNRLYDHNLSFYPLFCLSQLSFMCYPDSYTTSQETGSDTQRHMTQIFSSHTAEVSLHNINHQINNGVIFKVNMRVE